MKNLEDEEQEMFLIFVKEVDLEKNVLVPRDDIYLNENEPLTTSAILTALGAPLDTDISRIHVYIENSSHQCLNTAAATGNFNSEEEKKEERSKIWKQRGFTRIEADYRIFKLDMETVS